jgi:putative hydrolase of HD superfamily
MNAARPLQLDDVIKFSQLMLRFQDVIRVVDLPRGRVRENDVEHSYQLAMMAWYLNSAGDLGFDTDRMIRYALVHDLAETYTGDVSALDYEGRKGKAEREEASLNRMRQELPEAADLLDLVSDYDQRSDPEANFIYALDKLMPMLMVYLAGGQTWKVEGYSLELLHNDKKDKVALSKPVAALYAQLKSVLDTKPELFNS